MVVFEAISFMFFSVIETFAIYFLIMCLFRFKWQEFGWHALCLALLITVQSYILRHNYELGNLMPLVTMILFVLFFAAVARMPFIFSIFITVVGYAGFAVVQCLLAILFFGSISAISDSASNGYVLQLATSAVIFPVMYLLFRLGYGFTFDIMMNKLRFKFDDIMVIIMILLFFISVTSVLYANRLYVVTLFFIATSAALLYYAIRKQRHQEY